MHINTGAYEPTLLMIYHYEVNTHCWSSCASERPFKRTNDRNYRINGRFFFFYVKINFVSPVENSKKKKKSTILDLSYIFFFREKPSTIFFHLNTNYFRYFEKNKTRLFNTLNANPAVFSAYTSKIPAESVRHTCLDKFCPGVDISVRVIYVIRFFIIVQWILIIFFHIRFRVKIKNT